MRPARRLRYLCFFLLCAHAGMAQTRDIQVTEEWLVYAGDIETERNRRLFALAERSGITRLRITSWGGDVAAGIELGRWVFRHQVDIEVVDYCLSSCANYVFTAARNRTIAPGAVVAWHGNYIYLQDTGEWREEIPLRRKKYAESREEAYAFVATQVSTLAAMEKTFFAEIGVDPAICFIGKQAPWRVPNYFMLSPADMARFGLDNVTAPPGYPPARRELSGVDIRRISLGD